MKKILMKKIKYTIFLKKDKKTPKRTTQKI